MNSADITPEMARSIQVKLQSMLQYLGPLRDRMQKQRFPADDPLFVRVDAAYNAVFNLQFRVQRIAQGQTWFMPGEK